MVPRNSGSYNILKRGFKNKSSLILVVCVVLLVSSVTMNTPPFNPPLSAFRKSSISRMVGQPAMLRTSTCLEGVPDPDFPRKVPKIPSGLKLWNPEEIPERGHELDVVQIHSTASDSRFERKQKGGFVKGRFWRICPRSGSWGPGI